MKAWRDLRSLPRELWILSLATLVNRMGTMALPFLVVYLTLSLGFSAPRAGAVLALYGVVALVVAPFAGRLGDRWGALQVMRVCLVLSGLFLLLFPLARSWPAVLAMTVLFAAANEAFRPVNLALITAWSTAELRKPAFALSRLAVNLGMSVGPAVGGFLAQWSFPMLFVVDGLTALAAASVLVFSSFRTSPATAPPPETLQASDLSPMPPPARFLGALFSDPRLGLFLAGIFPVTIVFWQHQSTLPLFLIGNLGFPESAYGLLFTVNTLLIITVEVPLNSATSYWTHRRALALGSILFALGFGALAFARSFLAIGATVVVWTFGEMILFPAMLAYLSELAPQDRLGEYMGLYSMVFSLAFVVGPLVGTWALDRYGAGPFWLATLVVGALSVAMLANLKPPTRPPAG